MNVQGETERITWKYFQPVRIPETYKKFLWDHAEGTVHLEKFILRILTYGGFEDVRWLYQKYPQETLDVAHRYPHIKRGIKFWLKVWRDEERSS